MSNVFTFVLTIIAMSFSFALIKAWLDKRPDPNSEDQEASRDMLAKIDVLEERIRVLERIVTDGNHDLKKEIDQL